jgi:hypothetical protein
MTETFGTGYLQELTRYAEQKGILLPARKKTAEIELQAQVFIPPLELKFEVDKVKCEALKKHIIGVTIERNHINISQNDFFGMRISPDYAVEYVDFVCNQLNEDNSECKFKYTRIGLGVQIIKEKL